MHYWLAREKPDVAVVFYNDHGLNFFLDKMPTFAVGAASEYRNEDEGWGIPVSRSIAGDPALSWHIINNLVADEFDITMCQEMLVDHAVTIPMTLMWPGEKWTIRIVPISINTVQHPLPSLKRCLNLGRSVGRAINSYPQDLRVMIVGTGGLSHQLDGKRAGFINKEFDQLCMDKLVGRAGIADALFDPRLRRRIWRAGRRIPQLDGDARRADGPSARSAPQLSHPDFQHRGSDRGAGESRRGGAQSGLIASP